MSFFTTNTYGETRPSIKGWITAALMSIFVLVPGCMAGMPYYSVWEQGMTGRAELARAEQNRQIARFEAEAAVLQAQGASEAEVVRARGVAEANQIIADGLGGPDGYLEYLYIQALKDSNTDVVYVPTEAGSLLLNRERSNQD